MKKGDFEYGAMNVLMLVVASMLMAAPAVSHADFFGKFKEKLSVVKEGIGTAQTKVDSAKQKLDENTAKLDATVDEAKAVKSEATALVEDVKDPATQQALADKAKSTVANSKEMQSLKDGANSANESLKGVKKSAQKTLVSTKEIGDVLGK